MCHTESSAHETPPRAPLDRSCHHMPPASGGGSVMGYVHLGFLERRESHGGDLRHARPSSLGSYGHHRSSGSPGTVAPLENQWNLRRVCQGPKSYRLTHWVQAPVAWLRRPRGPNPTPGKNGVDSPNVVGALSHPGSQHNGVRAMSTRGAQHSVVRGWHVQMLDLGCHFDAGLSSDLVELFLQDKTFARVVGPRGGPPTIKLVLFRRVKSGISSHTLELLLF
ncbi:hypothetical protein GW17_00047447 [Ensete ventricosum]|nr:hypothetical protein GW17_00047447 [Ensete ventricosum]